MLIDVETGPKLVKLLINGGMENLLKHCFPLNLSCSKNCLCKTAELPEKKSGSKKKADMFGDMMEQLKQRMAEVKEKLETMTVTASSAGGAIKVTANGNRKIKSITISKEIQHADSEELEEQLTVAINRALEQSEALNESQMKDAASGMLPPGMF
jgi:nucleoid-associated protein EbfC